MLKIMCELTVEGIVKEIAAALKTKSSYERVLIIARTPLLHAAMGMYGAHRLPQGCEWLRSTEELSLLDSSAPAVFVDEEPSIPLGRRKIHLGPDHALVGSVPKAISFLLERWEAQHFLDAFDAQVTASLKMVMLGHGLLPFLDAVGDVLRQCESGKESEISVPVPNTPEGADNGRSGSMAYAGQFESLRGFLEKLCETQEPLAFLKAYIAYYSYLKSNRNVTLASKNLNISRTTLHDHLRLAKSLEICSRVEASFPELATAGRA